jgi:cytochrome c peroxidase
MPEMGFTGPVSELNRTTGSYPGSVRTRFSNRKPQSHAYAPLSPVLHYNPGQDDLVGGNFWDMRATGRRLGNPAAEQAEGPPTNPVEMGLPDSACAVYRASQRPYRGLFEQVWGGGAFSIQWPDEVEQVCNQPGPPPANDLMPIHLSDVDRSRADPGVAGFLRSYQLLSHPSEVDARWIPLTAHNQGRFQVPTLRNVDKRPYPGFVKARTMAISKISNRSCITTTRGTCCRAASRTIGARVQHAGRRRSRPTT